MWKVLGLVLCQITLMPAKADTYYRRVFFDNSTSSGFYFYSEGKASAPSQLELVDGKLPVEKKDFRTPPNALRLRWTTMPQGGWDAEIKLYEWRNREIDFPGDYLGFWCFSPDGIESVDLPRLALRDHQKGFTHPVPIGNFTRDVPAGRWIHVRIPLSRFQTASIRSFQPHQVVGVLFTQGTADGRQHTLAVDDLQV